jgi:glucose-6-phosphate 1-dehydrogenase
VEDRGAFYDAVGALRDVVQNHLLQVLALVAMEAPAAAGPGALWDKKADVFRAMPDADPDRCVLGQYEGYGKIAGVREGSRTETYVALRLGIDNWRWAGVPFYLRAGKALAARATEVRVIFRRPPRLAFLEEPVHPHPNQLVLRIDPEPGLRLALLSKSAEAPRPGTCTWTWRSPPSWASRPSPTSGSSMTLWPATIPCLPARTSSRRPGGSCSRW